MFLNVLIFILTDSSSSTPPIPITSDTNVWITESTPTKTSKLRIHVLTDNTLHISEKNEIAVPIIQEYSISPRTLAPESIHEDLSDDAFHNRHRKNELLEKKIKIRAQEVYNYEMHLKKLEQDSKSVTDLKQSEDLQRSQSVESLFLQATQEPSHLPFRVGAFQGREVYDIDEELVHSLHKKHKLKSVYINPLDGAVATPVISDKKKVGITKTRTHSSSPTKRHESSLKQSSKQHPVPIKNIKNKKTKTQSHASQSTSVSTDPNELTKTDKSRNSWLNIFKRVFQ